ncbi:MAG: cysteine desulfurase CsdA [Chloroflexi bacterium]|jgi:cysteine desulfurase/selenocysteine lyase|nr:cysteine desulfurase CsdA [Chloroflexota bacterium]MDP6496603.1 cysteine desulfurase [Dehalococcoidia bacterium]MQG54604.1 cysteine desulfurase [SAR202 cluster bacterium]|tara:strand:+ start:5417 stop:6643 length:1227 start_codon:yes stop_codon:yes gene_type:complete
MTTTFDINKIRDDFPILKQRINGNPLVYLDNGATSQKPQSVIDAIVNYYTTTNSNVHRGVHTMSQQATDGYEDARSKIRQFINADDDKEIIYTRNTTEGINLVAHSYGRQNVGPGDDIIVSNMEHHSNIVPWQMLCEEMGANLLVVPIDDTGELVMDEYEKMLSSRSKLVSITHVSNALGTILPAKQIVEMAHAHGAPVLLDGAQAVPHMPVDMNELDCDFYVFSGHKLFGPTGIGVLYGKKEYLEAMPPFLGGGEMIKSVTFEKTIYNDLPYKFEGGTPDIAGAIGLGAAIDYVNNLGFDQITAHEDELLRYGTEALSAIESLRIIGTAEHKAGILSFVIDKAHPHDIGTILDEQGIAVRTGHHCAQPVMARFQIPATARASLAFYNTKEDIDALVKGIDRVLEVFG